MNYGKKLSLKQKKKAKWIALIFDVILCIAWILSILFI